MIMIRVITVTCVKKAENWIDNLTEKQLYATSEEDAEMERDHVEAKTSTICLNLLSRNTMMTSWKTSWKTKNCYAEDVMKTCLEYMS